MEQTFEFGKISEEFSKILEDSKKIVSNYNNEIVESLAKDIEEIENQKLLTVAFIGQYNAGKSSIISALTGNKSIKIDSDISTDKTKDYEWNNVLLIDTPGICTDRKDHDDITYKKIKESDLLIYCLSNELFDNIILENFNKIAFDKKYGNKILLVINKMMREHGNYDELVKNYKESLNKSLTPHNLDEFPTCFIACQYYLEGISENDEELIELSHFNDFVKLINIFIKEKGIWAKFSTPIYRTISFIDNSILSISSKDNKEFFILIDRKEKVVRLKKQSVYNRVSPLLIELSSTIISYSNDIASKIGVENIDFDSIQKEIEEKIKKDAEETKDKIEKVLNEINEELNKAIKELFDSDLGKYVLDSINTQKLNINNVSLIDFTEIMSNFSSIEDITKKMAKSSNVFASSDKSVDTVKNIAHFFGFKFKPYGAIKIVKHIDKISKSAETVLGVLPPIVEIANSLIDENMAKKLSKAKQDCYNEFSKISRDIEKQFKSQLESYIKEVFDKILEQIKNLRANMIEEEKTSDSSVLKLKEYKKQLEDMLNHSSK
ncbi:GTPase [uncultured Brachyspira sp.]|uniref:GTPase n=1 Tax=uncultured Brachyspira sp. TaxID=221953 RepID=UPI00259788B8|nr:GTPase [uncultured Brachyspira sp.]